MSPSSIFTDSTSETANSHGGVRLMPQIDSQSEYAISDQSWGRKDNSVHHRRGNCPSTSTPTSNQPGSLSYNNIPKEARRSSLFFQTYEDHIDSMDSTSTSETGAPRHHHRPDNPVYQCSQLQAKLLTLQDFVWRQPGVPTPFAQKVTDELQQVGHSIGSIARLLQVDRDEARETLETCRLELKAEIETKEAILCSKLDFQAQVDSLREKVERLEMHVGQAHSERSSYVLGPGNMDVGQRPTHGAQNPKYGGQWHNNRSGQGAPMAGRDQDSIMHGSRQHGRGGFRTPVGSFSSNYGSNPSNCRSGPSNQFSSGGSFRAAMSTSNALVRAGQRPNSSNSRNDQGEMSGPSHSYNQGSERTSPAYNQPGSIIFGASTSFYRQPNLRTWHNFSNDVKPTGAELDAYSPIKRQVGDLFDLVKAWVSKYASKLDPGRDQEMSFHMPDSWEFLCGLVWPYGPALAKERTIALICDIFSRRYLVVRMILEYIVRNFWVPTTTWVGFDDRTDREFQPLYKKIADPSLPRAERQHAIGNTIAVIRKVLSHPSYADFRKKSEAIHTEGMKELIGPMVDEECDFDAAGMDMGHILNAAFGTYINMCTSGVTYLPWFPLADAQFNPDLMGAVNTTYDGEALKQKQASVSLVITPALSFRDDRGEYTKADCLLKSEIIVLTPGQRFYTR